VIKLGNWVIIFVNLHINLYQEAMSYKYLR